MNDFINVIIPTCARPESLDLVLDALAAQSVDPAGFRVIVVNNRPDEALTNLEERHPALDLTVSEERVPGAGATRNRGLTLADDGLVVFLDDDVIPDPGYLEAHRVFHRKNPSPALGAVGKLRYRSPEGRTPVMAYLEEGENSPYNFARSLPDEHNYVFFAAGVVSVKKSFLHDHGVFDPQFLRGQDSELGYRLHSAGLRITHLPEAGAIHWKFVTTEEVLRERRGYGHWYRRIREIHPDYPLHFANGYDEEGIAAIRAFVERAENLIDPSPGCGDAPLGATGLRRMLYEGYRALSAYEVSKGLDESAQPLT